MTTQLITAQFDGMPVMFRTDGFINATAIAKQFNKQPRDYLKSERTQEYMEAVKTILLTEQNQLVIIKQGGSPEEQGTWLHPKLAVDFARWLSIKFAVWCDLQIEKILHLKTAPINSDLAEIFLKPITKSLTPDDFEWRYQVLATAFQHLENATMVKTFKGSELLVGKRLVKSKRIF
jgi:hypothetical protein